MSSHASSLGGEFSEGLIPRRPRTDNADFDITAMIDLVFMMNIYFLVTFLGAATGASALPSASHGRAMTAETAVIITVAAGKDFGSVEVFIGDGKDGTPILEPVDQEERIAAAVEAGTAAGKTAVILKAEKNVRLREMRRISAATAQEGVTLHMAVMEKDDGE